MLINIGYKIPKKKPHYEWHLFKSTKGFVVILLFLCVVIAIVGHEFAITETKNVQASYYQSQVYIREATISALVNETKQKDETIINLQTQFDELMKNPVTFRQTYFLEHEILPRTRKQNIPDSLVAAQWALESKRAVYLPGNNYFGLMSWDNNHNRSLMSCPTLDECTAIYAKTIKNILSSKGYAYNPNEDPKSIILKLQTGSPRYEGDNSNPGQYVTLITTLPEWKRYSK